MSLWSACPCVCPDAVCHASGKETVVPVNRCVCKNISFAQLIELHEKTGADFDVIARETGCGSACGMCTPYAQAAIVTGKRSLPVSSPAQLMLLMRRAQNSKSRDTSRAM